MSLSKSAISKKIGIFLFSLGVVFSPASQLRFPGKSIGIGELCVLGSILMGMVNFTFRPTLNIASWPILQKKYLIFWLFSLILFLIGSVYAILIGKIDEGSTVHNFSAYTFGFLTIVSFLFFYSEQDKILGEMILTKLASFSGLLFLLYIYLFIIGVRSFANCNLYYELRFTGFGLNPNQLAFSCIPVPFLALNIYGKAGQTVIMKIWMVIVMLSSISVGVLTLSDALIVSWILGCVALYYTTYLRGLSRIPLKKIIRRVGLTLLILVICFLCLQQIESYTQETYGDGVINSQGSDRLLYWRNAIQAFTHSPVFGLGPGSYSGAVPFGKEEAHNSFLDWLVSTGIIGIFLLLYLLYYKWNCIWRINNKEYISIFFSLISFSMFHLILRHYLFWTLIIFL
jgi:O-antigen ligase